MKLQKLYIFKALVLCGSLAACGANNEVEPTNPTPSAPAEVSTDAPSGDIVDIATTAGQFNTLLTAAKAAGLVDALKGPGPLTVFAPTDEAFAKIPKETIDALLADTDKLTAILKYHIVAGRVLAKDVTTMTSATTLGGGELAIDASNGVRINDANVTKADILTSNGVIHVIDTVLLPR